MAACTGNFRCSFLHFVINRILILRDTGEALVGRRSVWILGVLDGLFGSFLRGCLSAADGFDSLTRFLTAKCGLLVPLLIRFLLRAALVHFRLRPVRSFVGLIDKAGRERDEKLTLVVHHGGKPHDILHDRALVELRGSFHDDIHSHHSGTGFFNCGFCFFQSRFVVRLGGELVCRVGCGLCLAHQGRCQLRGVECRHIVLRILRLGGFVLHFFGNPCFASRSVIQFINRIGDGILGDRIQLLPHFGICCEFAFEILEQVGGALVLHFFEHLNLDHFLVELLLDAGFCFHLAHFRARLD